MLFLLGFSVKTPDLGRHPAVQANHMSTSSCRPSPPRRCLSSRRSSPRRRCRHRRSSQLPPPCLLFRAGRSRGGRAVVPRTPHYGRRSSCTRACLASMPASRAPTGWLAWHSSARAARVSRTARRMDHSRARRVQASAAARLPRMPLAQPLLPPAQTLPFQCGNAAALPTPSPRAAAVATKAMVAAAALTSEAGWPGASSPTPWTQAETSA
jgi:hypothetical protein